MGSNRVVGEIKWRWLPVLLFVIFVAGFYLFFASLGSVGVYYSILITVVALYFLFIVVQLYVHRKLSILHPVVVYLLWRELTIGVSGDFFLLFNVNEIKTAVGVYHGHNAHEIIVKLFVLKLLSIIGFLIGFYAIKDFLFRRHLREIFDIKWLSCKALLLTLACILLVSYISGFAGGIDRLLDQRSIVYYERITHTLGGHYHAVVRAFPMFFVLILCVNLKYIKSPVYLTCLLISFVCAFLVTGNRSVILTSILMIAFIYSYEKSTLPWVKLVFVGLIVIFLFGFLGQLRSENPNSDKEYSLIDSVASTFDELRQRAVYVNGVIPILAKVPDDVDWLYGRSYLSVPFIIVPSSVLPFDKPPAGGRLTTDLIYERDNTGIPPMPLGEAFWNFGYLGVILLYVILGLMIRVLYNQVKSTPRAPFLKFLYIYSLLFFSLSSDAMFNFFQFMLVSLVLYFVIKFRGYNFSRA